MIRRQHSPLARGCQQFGRHLLALLFLQGLILMLTLVMPASAGQENIRILIDTKALTLKVMQGKQETLSIANIAVGRYGTTSNKQRGDNKTPLGHFAIGWIGKETSFHRFFGLNYPDRQTAERAFKAGRLDQKTLNRIRRAIAVGQLPPQNTILGGNLGIHGIGKGDTTVHEQFNWTNGCVAMTNEQIDSLAAWITIGTPVDIR